MGTISIPELADGLAFILIGSCTDSVGSDYVGSWVAIIAVDGLLLDGGEDEGGRGIDLLRNKGSSGDSSVSLLISSSF